MTTLVSYDPSTGEAIGEVDIATAQAVNEAVTQASKAQKAWGALTLEARAAAVTKAYDGLIEQVAALSDLLAKEQGKDRRRANGEVGGAVSMGEYLASEAVAAFKSQPVARGTELQYRPLGVVAVIAPWNYPVMMANNLIVPALIAGNSVILKPSEHTPLIAEVFFGQLAEALPDGVLQVLQGDGDVGRALVSSDVQMVAFTGSKAVGHDIMARSAPTLKRLVMELGGNDPMIVMANANIDNAAYFAVAGSFENAGQMCTSIERIYVDRAVAEAFEQRVVQIARQYKTGPWHQAGVNIGPIINAKQHQTVVSHIADAEAKGATVLLGGSEQTAPYIKPTVLTGMSRDMLIEQQETFGPVVAISRFDTVDEAVARANDSDYGLGAVVFGGAGVEAVAERLEAGMIGINQGQGGGGNAPWVGAKQSGYGYHGSAEGHRQFSQVRVVSR
ncbi:Succinate-semialdehyde dehydrogenase [NADP(+)] [Sinobacterium norvegicum]|uniref:Succinate-semialdehyde dehydrogenase [NADP(+)] n=1 Tax=Sinobacterium norvegicum TaxID=1641715 RepID=A0ABM9ACH9_9GAMM|nr:aldehyde dehydrogenase family protein [Sinobacterium norvegicum]CAH0990911.1 Succinate-semialdehyde dehydrogenase [NADP(+)] [Sinobacterium norvegicum]